MSGAKVSGSLPLNKDFFSPKSSLLLTPQKLERELSLWHCNNSPLFSCTFLSSLSPALSLSSPFTIITTRDHSELLRNLHPLCACL
ncbi:hypothetical protein K1719_037278 [Acacia pycnantha]|nr:hypothetical protein K1719_037278 [Acacia pycnantha]